MISGWNDRRILWAFQTRTMCTPVKGVIVVGVGILLAEDILNKFNQPSALIEVMR